MKNLVFLASAEAKKPEILMRCFYEKTNKKTSNDILLTNSNTGNVVDLAKQLGLEIIVTNDLLFLDESWIKKTLFVHKENVLVSCGWPYKIPSSLINTFSSAINCHGSYLPDYRGSRAYMHYWANCSNFFGATIHYLTDKFDDGNILVREKLEMEKDESQNSVFIRTAELCGRLLPKALELIEESNPGFVDKDGLKRYFFKMTPEEFEKHRKINEKLISEGKEPVLTRHKIIK